MFPGRDDDFAKHPNLCGVVGLNNNPETETGAVASSHHEAQKCDALGVKRAVEREEHQSCAPGWALVFPNGHML